MGQLEDPSIGSGAAGGPCEQAWAVVEKENIQLNNREDGKQ